jgi:hypothetical protein
MNERIKQIAEECGLSIAYDNREVTNKELEFFAELIIKECIQELETSKKCDPYTGDLFDCEYNTCINDQIIMLTEQFGVE